MISFILTEKSLTVLGEKGNDINMHRDHGKWDEAMAALAADDEALLLATMQPKTALDHMNKLVEGRFRVVHRVGPEPTPRSGSR